MNIVWDRVTWYSQLIAIILFVGTFGMGILLGMHLEKYGPSMLARGETQPESQTMQTMPTIQHNPNQMSGGTQSQQASTMTYRCDSGKEIQAQFANGKALLSFSDDKPDTYTNCAQIAAPISP